MENCNKEIMQFRQSVENMMENYHVNLGKHLMNNSYFYNNKVTRNVHLQYKDC